MTTVAEAFDSTAGTYDASRRKLIPGFDDFYGVAVDVATSNLAPGARVLDLGAGTGLLSLLLAAVRPDVSLCLVDVSTAMLDLARRHLADRGLVAQFHPADLTDDLPEGPWDAVVSALAIHHLVDDDKRRLFERVCRSLRPGGVFVNAEQVAGPTPALDAAYHRRWLHETTALGATAEDHAGAAVRMAHDLPSPVFEQCRWLEESGFAHVDLCFKRHRFAVFAAWAPDHPPGAGPSDR